MNDTRNTLPEGWEAKRLDEIGDVYSGSTPSTNNPDFWDGGIVWLTPNDLSKLNTPYISNSSRTISEKGLRSSSTHLLPPRSIVISSRAPIGYVAIPEAEFCTNQGCKCIKLDDGYNSEFVYYNLNFHIEKLKTVGNGTTFNEITKTELCAVQLPFPERETEQTQIAAVLSCIDRAIEYTEALIAKQQRIKTGLMQDLLTKGIDEHGNIRSEATHEFKDSPLGRIPKEWEVSLLDNAIRIIDCKHYTPKFAPTGFPFVRPRNVKLEGLDLSGVDYVSEADFKNLTDKHEPRLGDIVFSRNASFGVPCFVETSRRFAIGQDVVVMTKLSENTRYIYFVLLSHLMEQQIAKVSTGSTFGRINLAFIRKLIVPLPSNHEQQEIVSVLGSKLSYIQKLVVHLSKLHKLKTGLMQDLLTGKVSVSGLLAESSAGIA